MVSFMLAVKDAVRRESTPAVQNGLLAMILKNYQQVLHICTFQSCSGPVVTKPARFSHFSV